MNKEKAYYLIGLQYTKIIEGSNTFNVNSVDYVFKNAETQLSGLQIAKQLSVIKGLSDVKFKDSNNVYTIPMNEFDQLLATILLAGDVLWEKKIEKYSLLESATTEEDIDVIVNSDW